MAHSLSKILVHIVFSTKSGLPFLKEPSIREEMNLYLAGILKNCGSPAIIINTAIDHVHILCLLSRQYSTAKLLEIIKKDSSKWVKTKGEFLHDFAWQTGYGIFSVSQSQVDTVKQYIINQEQHHNTMSFKEEFIGILDRYEVDYDEKYLWE